MPTRNVVLTNHQAAMVERLVTSGRYQNASEVLRDGLRLVRLAELLAGALVDRPRFPLSAGHAGGWRGGGGSWSWEGGPIHNSQGPHPQPNALLLV